MTVAPFAHESVLRAGPGGKDSSLYHRAHLVTGAVTSHGAGSHSPHGLQVGAGGELGAWTKLRLSG